MWHDTQPAQAARASQGKRSGRICAADNELASLISELARTLQQWLNACL